MFNSVDQILHASVRKLLRPLVRLLLRHGVGFDTFADWARQTYVEVAEQDFDLPNRKQTTSRISVITGLTRKEVVRTKNLPGTASADRTQAHNRAARVIGGWVRDHALEQGDQVAALPLEGEGASFSQLVRRHSGDMPTRAVLDELIRVGAVERTSDGMLHLVRRAYVPQEGNPDLLAMLGRDTSDLISTIEHNLRAAPSERYLQRIVSYDNLPAECLQALRQAAAKEAQALLERFDKRMSPHDRDVNPRAAGSGRHRAVVGIYYFQEDAAPKRPINKAGRSRKKAVADPSY
jgi:Family of unknown function (DUF6502)